MLGDAHKEKPCNFNELQAFSFMRKYSEVEAEVVNHIMSDSRVNSERNLSPVFHLKSRIFFCKPFLLLPFRPASGLSVD
jgi:hypothetical protein